MVSRAVLGFVMAHPGCFSGQGTRQRYGDGFRRFLVELRAQYEAMPPGSPRDLNSPNRPLRTRMPGGVGGVPDETLGAPIPISTVSSAEC